MVTVESNEVAVAAAVCEISVSCNIIRNDFRYRSVALIAILRAWYRYTINGFLKRRNYLPNVMEFTEIRVILVFDSIIIATFKHPSIRTYTNKTYTSVPDISCM